MLNNLIADLEKIGWKKSSLVRKHANLVVDPDQLLKKLCRINPRVPADFIQKYVNELRNFSAGSLFFANKEIFKLIRQGKDYGQHKVKFFHPEWEKNDFTYLVDFPLQSPNQQHTFSLNSVLLVNYLPLVVVVVQENKTKSFQVVKDYQNHLPQLYKYNFFSILRTPVNDFVGVITDEIHNYLAWRLGIQQLLPPPNLLGVFGNYLAFRLSGEKKVLARYYQYSATEKILTAIKEKQKGGVIWHATGSGKSLTMVFATARILTDYPQSTIFLITDRQQLDQQLYNFFTEFPTLINPGNIIKVDKISSLTNLLKKPNYGKVIFIILHKFSQKFQDGLGKSESEFKNPHETLVFVDEAHRSQNLKTQSNKPPGYARIVREIIPTARFFAWTGTPISTEDKSTYAEFGSSQEPLHSYSTKEARDDQIIVNDIYYEYYHLHPAKSLMAMINKIKTDYENLIGQGIAAPKFLVMLSEQKEAQEFYRLFCQEEKYREIVCLIISEIKDRKEVIQKFKNNNSPNIAIVVEMLTTGFDLPTLRIIYIGKKVQSASDFWQKISRVNRLATDKKVGHIIDFVDNSSTLEEAKKRYFGDENFPLISPTEAVATCLKKLRQILTNNEKTDLEATVGYLLRNKKEKDFAQLVRKIEEIVISPDEQIKEGERDFFSNCRKIITSLSQLSDSQFPKFFLGTASLPTKKDLLNDEGVKKLREEYIYDEEYCYLLALVTKLKKLQEEFSKWNIPRKILKKLAKLISEWEERDPARFDFFTFHHQAEANWKIMKNKYEEIQENLAKNPNYLVEKKSRDYLRTDFPFFFRLNETKLASFLATLSKIFAEKFHDDPDWFLINETYSANELEKSFDETYFKSYQLPSWGSLEEKQKMRKNIINIVKESFYA